METVSWIAAALYCSALIILAKGRLDRNCDLELDPECPNLSFHQNHSSNGRHPLSRSDVVELVSEQLNCEPDHCCRPMGKEGLHCSLFAITLDVYGYTFIGKGTEYASITKPEFTKHSKLCKGTLSLYISEISTCGRTYVICQPVPSCIFS